MSLRVLTWNLLHGRAVPSAGRELFDEFAGALEGWAWDVALLQECPPWWPELLGDRLGADWRRVLTSRNALLPLRRAVAERWPDVIRSNGGGANAVLARSARVSEHRTLRLRTWPERRWLQAARLESRVWVANLHATVRDAAAAEEEAHAAARRLADWAGAEPAVLGGDFNIRSLSLEEFGFRFAGGHDVDMVFIRGLSPVPSGAAVLERGRLSDHAPVAVTIAAGAQAS
jgi:endonuclease/exonuclease/phosphatase family metal-dependent hydrolase